MSKTPPPHNQIISLITHNISQVKVETWKIIITTNLIVLNYLLFPTMHRNIKINKIESEKAMTGKWIRMVIQASVKKMISFSILKSNPNYRSSIIKYKGSKESCLDKTIIDCQSMLR